MLVERVEEVLKENVKEIWLTSEDLGAYGRDINVTLPKLLDSLLPLLPKGMFYYILYTYIYIYIYNIIYFRSHDTARNDKPAIYIGIY